MYATALDSSDLPAQSEACTRCGTYAALQPFWGRRLCTACVERESGALRGGVGVGALLKGLGSLPSRLWFLSAGLHCAAGLPSFIRTLAGDESMRGLSFEIMLDSVMSAIITYVGVAAVLGRKVELRDAFAAFRRRFGHWLGSSFMAGLWVLLFSLLLVVPGIVKAMSLALLTPILLFEAVAPAKEVFAKSTERMRGARLSAFVAYALFFLMHILVTVIAAMIVGESATTGARFAQACAELLGVALGSPVTLVTVLLYVRLTPPDALSPDEAAA